MEQEWILQTKETRRTFSNATWVPLRAYCDDAEGEIRAAGYVSDLFACRSVAFLPEHRENAESLGWGDIGLGHSIRPHAYTDLDSSSIEQYPSNENDPIGVTLVFEHPHS